MNTQEALKMAIEALKYHPSEDDALQACKEALAQPAQEPVAWDKIHELLCKVWHRELNADEALDEMQLDNFTLNPLYTHPAPSWQGLSLPDIEALYKQSDSISLYAFTQDVRAIEAKLKEKNHG